MIYDRVEEGTYENGEWKFLRVWNGDQTDYGLNFSSAVQLLRVKLATYGRRRAEASDPTDAVDAAPAALGVLLLATCNVAGTDVHAAARATADAPRQALSLDQGWRFHLGDIPFPKIDGSRDGATPTPRPERRGARRRRTTTTAAGASWTCRTTGSSKAASIPEAQALAGLPPARRRLVPPRTATRSRRPRQTSRTAVRRHRHARHDLVQRRAGESQLVAATTRSTSTSRRMRSTATSSTASSCASTPSQWKAGGTKAAASIATPGWSSAIRCTSSPTASTPSAPRRRRHAGRCRSRRRWPTCGDGAATADVEVTLFDPARPRGRAGRHDGAGADAGTGDGEAVAAGIRRRSCGRSRIRSCTACARR